MDKRLKITQQYLGKSFTSKHGEIYEVIEVNSCNDVTIKYSDGLLQTCKTVNIRNGNPPNPNRITTCGLGFTGVGPHKISEKGIKTDAYVKWQAMFARVYGKVNKSTLCYEGCSISPEWFNFQNFGKWFEEEKLRFKYYEGKLCLDKDLLNFKSKEYSSTSCCLLPYEVNIAIQLITTVYFDKRRGVYEARLTRSQDSCSYNTCSIGRYLTVEEAVEKYCTEKDKYIARLSNTYSQHLSDIVVDSLNNFNTRQRLQFKGVS